MKNLVFNGDGKGKKHPNVKALMGLCSAVVDNKEEIEKMMADSQILVKEVPLSKNRNLARVLIAELVWGKGTSLLNVKQNQLSVFSSTNSSSLAGKTIRKLKPARFLAG